MEPLGVYPGIRIENKEIVRISLNETPCNLVNSQRFEALVENTFVGKVKFKNCDLKETPNSIYIQSLKNKTKTIKGVGTALVQKVIELSFQRGLKGHVTLMTANSSHVFYWKLGFRIEPPFNLIHRSGWEREIGDLAKEMKLKGLTPNDESIKDDPRMQRALESSKLWHPDITPAKIFKVARAFDFKHEEILKAIQSEIPKMDTSCIGYTHMYLPDESIQIWKAILDDPSTKEENFKKLANIPQPTT